MSNMRSNILGSLFNGDNSEPAVQCFPIFEMHLKIADLVHKSFMSASMQEDMSYIRGQQWM